jgi:hypothetical protein
VVSLFTAGQHMEAHCSLEETVGWQRGGEKDIQVSYVFTFVGYLC